MVPKGKKVIRLLVLILLSAAPCFAGVDIVNVTASIITNQPVSYGQVFVDGDISNCVIPYFDGAAAAVSTYQTDVKNRYPDGSLRFAIVSYIIPAIASQATIHVRYDSTIECNNTGQLSPSQMLGSDYNFDGQIQIAGSAANHSISARAILNRVTSCASVGSDPDGTIASNVCAYWLQGPVLTDVILEDRRGRGYDVNTDGNKGNPLHPIFEARFYPATKQVELGYTLEDAWASTTAENSARDQTYSLVLTGENSNPRTLFTNSSFTQITRTRWHKTFCINGTGAGTANGCMSGRLHIDHQWGYLASTKAWPNWEPDLHLSSSFIARLYAALFGNTAALNLGGCASCLGQGPGIANFEKGMNAGGGAPWHGPLTTWDITYLISQCDAANSTSARCGNGAPGDMYSLMLSNADLGGMIPYFFREADNDAGHGQTFDNSRIPGNIATQGRIVSINARTQINLIDVGETRNQCNVSYPADYISYGGSGQDKGGWDLDTSHWPNLAYTSYLITGQYAYFEEQVMQSGNAIGNSGGTRACETPTQGSSRMGAAGYWGIDQERQTAWQARENALGAFVAVDGSPEKGYFEDKLRANLAVWEGCHNIPNDIPGNYSAAWTFGKTVRGVGYTLCQGTTPLYSWTQGLTVAEGGTYSTNPIFNKSGPNSPGAANSNFMNDYSAVIIGWIDDLGYCPHTNGACQSLQSVENWFINVVENPDAGMFVLGDYVYPTLNASGGSITGWKEFQAMYSPDNWPRRRWGADASLCGDEGYGAEGVAALSYGFSMTSNEGYAGTTAYNKARTSLLAACSAAKITFPGPNGSPKWDIVPREVGSSTTRNSKSRNSR